MRKIKLSTKILLLLFTFLIGAAGFGFVFITDLAATKMRMNDIALEANVLVSNEEGELISLDTPTVFRKDWSNQYFIEKPNGEKVMLGEHGILIKNEGLTIFGGGYQILSNEELTKLADVHEVTNLNEEKFYKLADRKYLMVAPFISEKDEVFTTEKYAYISLDKIGNALLTNREFKVKTTMPTIVTSETINFDIANELLILNENEIDLKKIIGTTNEFEPKMYQEQLEENPDELNLEVEGGTGGTGGDGGTGGIGGSGGKGGSGGQGGAGGAGSTGTVDIVKNISLRGVERGTNALTVSYYAADPFGQYGIIYMELYKGDVDLTDSNKKPIGNRSTVNLFDNQYIFSGLEPDTYYQVVMGHETEEEDVIDDVIRVVTLPLKSSLNVTLHEDGILSYELKLDPGYSLQSGYIELCTTNGQQRIGESQAIDIVSAKSNLGASGQIVYTDLQSANMNEKLRLRLMITKDGINIRELISIEFVNNYYVKTE